MTENNLIENIIEIYQNAIHAENQEKRKDAILNLITKHNVNKRISDLKKEHSVIGIPEEVTNTLVEAIKLEYKTALSMRDNLSLVNRNDTIKTLTENYFQSVKDFSENGGKNFYDVGSIVYFNENFSKIVKLDFLKKINQLKDKGLDIKIIEENDNKAVVVLPSSQYFEYENAINNLSNKYRENALEHRNFFISPLIRKREMIEKIENHKLSNRSENDSKYDLFHSYGYFLNTIDTLGGYNYFTESLSNQHLKQTISESLFHINLYNNEKAHINGMVPTNLCYSKDENNLINKDLEEKTRKTISYDLSILKIEKEEVLLNKDKKNKISIKP